MFINIKKKAYALICLAFSAVLYTDNLNWSKDYEWLLNNWFKGVISDITLLSDTSSECPSGYEDFFNYTYPGIRAWCNCSSGDSYMAGKVKTNKRLSC